MSGLGFEEKKVESSGIFEQVKLDELTPEVGTSVAMFLVKTPIYTGDDGEFMVCNCLQVDLGSKTIDEMVENAKPVSFAARSILEKSINDGQWKVGQIARLEQKIRRGDLYKGKKVKYFAWDIYIQGASNDIINKLETKLAQLEGKTPQTMTETAAESEQPKVKPKL